MKYMRIHEVAMGGYVRTVIDTPIALTPFQRARTRFWATENYKKRLKGARGWKKAGIQRILMELEGDTFLERPVPMYDSEKEVTIWGGQ